MSVQNFGDFRGKMNAFNLRMHAKRVVDMSVSVQIFGDFGEKMNAFSLHGMSGGVFKFLEISAKKNECFKPACKEWWICQECS